MKELHIEERKRICVEILLEFDNICKEQDITYFLAYGTLLGAIRHQGFIPWDDDVDVWVPIEEYFQLIQVLKLKSKYKLLECFGNENWPMGFSKLSDPSTIVIDNGKNQNECIKRGLAIDIFPLFSCLKQQRWINKLHHYQNNIFHMYNYRNNIICCKSVFKLWYTNLRIRINLMTSKNICYWQEKLYIEESREKKDNYVGSPISIYGIKDIYLKEWFETSIKMKFENYLFSVPVGYDNILRNLYNNYLELPEMNKRVSNHNVKVYLFDEKEI